MASFQYPDLGSFDCNPTINLMGLVAWLAFSILTSDRLTATAARHFFKWLTEDFQYPDLGSFDCNDGDPGRGDDVEALSVS